VRRIGYLINQYPKVSHSFIRREIQALERQGCEVTRFSVRGWQDVLADPEDLRERERTRYLLQGGLLPLLAALASRALGSPLRFLSALRLALHMGWRGDRPLPYHLIYLAEACLLLPWLRQACIEHMHAHFGTNATEVAQLVHRLGGPGYSFTVHGPEEFDKPTTLKLADKVVGSQFVAAVSSFGCSQLYRWLASADWPKVQQVRCGVDPAFHEVPRPPSDGGARFVCVGRLCEQKGQLLLLQAVDRLRLRGLGCELVLAGDGEMRSVIEAEVDRLGLHNQVRITGWIGSDAVRHEILAARALVLPSFAEGLPVVLMEALALQRPVISTMVAGIPELVHHGQNGWLVPAGDIDALADAMACCLRAEPAELAAMGERGQRRVRERHSVDTEARRLLALFDAACAAPRSP
jgi:colanic acid/amylovoran biosynthesis glycosyltransferase